MKTRIEIAHLKGNDTILYQCSTKQIFFIKHLMEERNMTLQFNKYFTFKNKPITNHLTKTNASKLISALLKGNEIVFGSVNVLPQMKLQKIKTHYDQPKPIN